ncbi:hypothetical protein BKA69DRAFT_1037270 [Paraphysoderma sedebokerense]|nr:hypothetical protein BKA69DRAFT_1037270 [Paraphysoderma sedebokerense]
MQSFDANGSSLNTGSRCWVDSHSGGIPYTESPITNTSYFTGHGRVRIIDGDGTADGTDWAVFNFGPAGSSHRDFDNTASVNPFFGGKSMFSGGTGGIAVSVGMIWGYNSTSGWTVLYQLPLPGDATFNHINGNWFSSGGSVLNGYGKRIEYDTLQITHLGFSVTTAIWLPTLVPAVSHTIPTENITAITNTSALAFSYITLPGPPQTLLTYLQGFDVSATSQNNGSGLWLTSHSGDYPYTESPIASIDYFTRQGRVRVIDGDGSSDGSDWAVFNFGPAANGDFDGSATQRPYFGGESIRSGGTGGFNVSIGMVWGYNSALGWTILYVLPLTGDTACNHINGDWFTSNSGKWCFIGKRMEFDLLPITHLGFSVSAAPVPHTIPTQNISAITSTLARAFSYITLPGSPRTLLNYLQSFGVNGSSQNTGNRCWLTSLSGDIPYTESPISNVSYFTDHGRVRLIDGDGSSGGNNWAVFNFGPARTGWSSSVPTRHPHFGGNYVSGGTGGVDVSVGIVWGHNSALGWTPLYQLPLPGDSMLSYSNGDWFTSSNGGQCVTHMGFSVGTLIAPLNPTSPIIPTQNITPIAATSALAFSHITLPGSPRTLLNYLQSFGVTGSTLINGGGCWHSSHSGEIPHTESPITNVSYFTGHGRVRVIDGDRFFYSGNWAAFNFGSARITNYDAVATRHPYFGGMSFSGGTAGLNVSVGRIWGYNSFSGWTLLYQLSLPGSSQHDHSRGNWLNSGGTVVNGHGKRIEYDNVPLTHIGFSVGTV